MISWITYCTQNTNESHTLFHGLIHRNCATMFTFKSLQLDRKVKVPRLILNL